MKPVFKTGHEATLEDVYLTRCGSSSEGCVIRQLFKRPNHERFWEADGTKPYIRLLRRMVASMTARQVATGCNCKPPRRRVFKINHEMRRAISGG